MDECASNPCVNGTCLDGVDFYQCACAPGWTGTDCDIDSDGCDPDPCVHGLCDNGINGDYTCYCDLGYEGQNCEVDHDDCNPNPCQNGGTCVDGVNSYTCQCPAGYSGTHCETQATACPCSSAPEWQAALAASPLPAGSCSDDPSWPGPCGSAANDGQYSNMVYLRTGDESAAWALYSGFYGSDPFCAIYEIQIDTSCSYYGGFEKYLRVTSAQASACQAEILSWAQQKGATCHSGQATGSGPPPSRAGSRSRGRRRLRRGARGARRTARGGRRDAERARWRPQPLGSVTGRRAEET
ncbi:calcium-binding EGF-like domain-containing protein [Sorangium cellulosum]